MRKWLSGCVLAGCLLASSCTRMEIVKPDLWVRPLLPSFQTMLNSRTQEPGFWIDRPDTEALMKYIQHNEHLRKSY